MRALLALAMVTCLLATGAGLPVAIAAPESSLNLSQAWQAALKNDPSYQAAISEREAGETNRALGRAGLLPQISASLGRSKTCGTLDSPQGPCGNTRSDLGYKSSTNELRATQSVFDWSRISEYRQGHARADYSLAAFDTQAKDTAIRLVNRYFQTLLSYENVVLAESKVKADEQQITVAERRFDSGEGTVIDIREVRSRRDLARADLILARDALRVARRELQEMVGSPPQQLATLKSDFQPQALAPATLADWQALTMARNAEIRAGQESVRIFDHEIHRTFGGHLPSLELIAAWRDVSNDTLSTRDQDSVTTSFGFHVALPIFSGGLTSAQVRQARHNRERAFQELAATREQAEVEVTRQYHAVVSGAQRIDALVTAVDSTATALKAIEMGYQAGTRSIVDILDAQDLLYRSRLELTQARLQYVLARLMLSAVAGGLSATSIDAVSLQYFGHERVVVAP